MTTSVTVPVTVTPEAAARLAELGFQSQAERMIDYARQNLPDLVRIEVVLNERYDMGGEPGVVINAWSRGTFDPNEPFDWSLTRWMTRQFPPEVLEHLHLSHLLGADHAG
jgi:hypothetical protein